MALRTRTHEPVDGTPGRGVAAALALGLGAVLLAPAETRAFEVFGDSLDLRQRDFRVHDSFTDPGARDNDVPDPDFPGSTGATLAIRKAVAEWGSTPRGATDPLQARIGDGGAAFDSYWAGPATGPGGVDGNVVSALAGTSFILAFTELPIGDGWRIQFYDGAKDWDDGPGQPTGGAAPWDIQGVMTHEYGHALGLDHSAVPGATMRAGAGASRGVDLRSIEPDDIAGVQFIYGVAAPTKPRVTGYRLTPSGVTLEGVHFDATSNDVWFTPATPGDGTPLIVHAGGSPGGDTLDVTLPPGAGAGDVLVKVPGSTGQHLSNAFPFDPAREPWSPPRAYGAPGTSSAGTALELTLRGLPSATAGSFTLDVRGGPVSGTALLFSGPRAARLSGRFGDLLIGGPWRRESIAPVFLGGAELTAPVHPAEVGATRYYQVLVLDPGLAAGGALTGAFEIQLQP